MKKLVIIIGILLLAGIGTVSANLVANGGFESPVISNPDGFVTYGFNGLLPNWTVERNGVDQISTYWDAYEGAQSMDMAALSSGVISQSIPTQIGQNYTLTFALSGNPACGPTPAVKTLEVYWDGISIGFFTFDTTGHSIPGDMGWVVKTIPDLKATKTSTVIRFEDESFTTGDNTACGAALDAVDVEPPFIPTPEFPTVALPAAFIVGLLGAVLFIQKSKE